MSRYELFDRRRVELWPLDQRGHDLLVANCLPLGPPEPPFQHAELPGFVERIVAARRQGRPVILMMGAHPIKLGLSRFLIDLIQRKWITHLATNGAGLVHDFELASFGGTSENVAALDSSRPVRAVAGDEPAERGCPASGRRGRGTGRGGRPHPGRPGPLRTPR